MTATQEGADFGDRTDFANADRGFLAAPEYRQIETADGKVAWDFDALSFLDDDCPDTVNPSLWRQSQLCARVGLYQVVDGVYQIRGFDLSNMTLIEGTAGVIVVDPLVSAEPAAAGLALYRKVRGDKPVTGVIYTHSHIDHFGGVGGVLEPGSKAPILAPDGFMAEAVSENVYAGTAMLRRGMYYSAGTTEHGPTAGVGMGLGYQASAGTVGLVPPTKSITETGQEETVDGVRFVFQMTPGTEAPSEMNFLLPDHRALCMAENATHNLHNILTLRGAKIRDARIWSHYLGQALDLFAGKADVVFASHHWPTWGEPEIRQFLETQRDLYGYLHDQTLRMMNQGYVGAEIAELIQMPPALDAAWHTHGYYGSVSHNVKAIYQRYLGWYSGHPSDLWEQTPVETAKRYAICFGGVPNLVAKAREYADDGDLRFAAQLLKHAVFADPANQDAKSTLADVFDRLALGAECATWRNCYVTGADELRNGVRPTAIGSSGMAGALSVPQLFDTMAIRVDGPKAWDLKVVTDWHFTDLDEHYRLTLQHGVLTYGPQSGASGSVGAADATFTLTKPQFLAVLGGGGLDGVEVEGDPAVLQQVTGVLDEPDPNFAIVTP
ncbi:beta-lactamase domain protein [Catenulispora acidiphila DSM 44928]|uniref:Beta-lactamase domain protein n=1 Tax=Catenulispora acidiphila (strain DSM 44928 / JCM 14897 / NBRC 102108 / NRRL B-24433 / ID139908) TaxID=479433 RepID=C7Q1X5_CATAD|nr:alkyl sulfatase dimerization domain-containing protein [Catenulispora acidiphila]ACU75676.1 beta-lactamase domain protein [Catenulispora acidiphila DSM 44928]